MVEEGLWSDIFAWAFLAVAGAALKLCGLTGVVFRCCSINVGFRDVKGF